MRYIKHILAAIILISAAFPVYAECTGNKFVVWGDTQFQQPEFFDRVVKETELLQPAFVLHVGDMIHGYSYDPENVRRQWKRFKKQIEPLTVPFYPTPGNHDLTTPEIIPLYGEAWGEDRYYYSFDHENIHVIVLNIYSETEPGVINEEQMNWLREDLQKTSDSANIFVSIHAPLHLDNTKEWKPVHEQLKKRPVRAVFTSHAHIYDHRVTDGIHYFCLNTSGITTLDNHLMGQSRHYLLVSVKKNDCKYAVITEDRIFPADAVPPGQYEKAETYLSENQTIPIPDPAKSEVRIPAEITIANKSPETRDYKLTWETDDYRWKFEPWGADFKLGSGEENNIIFQIHGPKDEFSRKELPRLRVETPYKNERGWSTVLKWYYHLFAPPEIRARKLNGDINLDGEMEEAAWRTAPAITRLHTDDEGATTTEKNVVKVLYDNENLYVGMWGEEPQPEGLSAYASGGIPLVFGDDDFEIYLDPNRDMETFYRMMVNPAGTTLSSGPEGLFTYDFYVETHIGQSFWSAEFRIPFSELNIDAPTEGDRWGFNVRRHRMQAEPSRRDWSWMQNYPYQPGYFGLLRFD